MNTLRLLIAAAGIATGLGLVAGHWTPPSGAAARFAEETDHAAGIPDDLRAAMPQQGPTLPRPEVVRTLRGRP